MTQTHPRVAAYLERLDGLLRGAPPAVRSEVLAGVREHLDDSLGTDADDARVREALAGLGSPEQIADEAYALVPTGGPTSGPSTTRARDRRWLPAVVVVLGFLVLLLLVFFALTGPHPAELFLALAFPPLWPVLVVLVVVSRGWTVREKGLLIGIFPLSCVVVAVVVAVSWGFSPTVGAASSIAALVVCVVASGTVLTALGRRGLQRAR